MANYIQWMKIIWAFALWKIISCHTLYETSGVCDVTFLSSSDPHLTYTPNATRIRFGELLHFGCVPGYALRGQEYGECLSSGRISISGNLFCEDLGIRCGFDKLDKAHLAVTPNKPEYRCGETVHLQCSERFVLRGPSSTSCTVQGTFDLPNSTVCEAETWCYKTSSTLNVPNLVVTPNKEKYRYNETVSLRCKDGFTLQGSSQATCFQGFEAQDTPSCIADYCDASWVYSQHPGIQYMSKEDPSRLEVGESISFRCEEGYRLRGASSIKCLPNGELEGAGLMVDCEKVRCSKNSLVEGASYLTVWPDKQYYDFNETVYIDCEVDSMYNVLYGPKSARCEQNGWEFDGSSLPKCGMVFCDTTSLHQRGMYTTPSVGDRVEVGTRLHINCHEGYHRRCAETLLCLPTGRLDLIEPICQCDADRPLQ